MKQKSIGFYIFAAVFLTGMVFAQQNAAAAFFLEKNVKELIEKQSNHKASFIDGEIIVKTKGGSEPFKIIKVAKGAIWEKVKEMNSRADVEYAEPNYVYQAQMIPNDPNYAYQWSFKGSENGGINAEQAWDVSTGSNSTVVAVIDSGVAYENYGNFCQAPDLANTCFVPGYNYLDGTTHANDDNGHGTHVAGTIAQSTNNGIGTAGIAHNACIMPIKVLDSTGSGTMSDAALAVRYAADKGAKVINLSLGGTGYSATMEEAVKYAYDKGVSIFAACGNSISATCLYPAAHDSYVIAVGATQYNKTLAPYSNFGPSVDIVAPGGNTSYDENGDGHWDGIMQQTFQGPNNVCNFDYYIYQGTSMATPHAAATAALLIANGNATTPDQIRTALQSTALDLGAAGRDDTYGYGLIDASRALQWTDNPDECASNADCDDSLFCNGAETCQAGKCVAGAAATCDDDNPCTTDSCNESLKKCDNAAMGDNAACAGGVCCAGVCKSGWAACSAPETCWNGSNKYLYHNSYQYKKFCKCTQGTYAYIGYKVITTYPARTIAKYNDSGNNTNWQTTLYKSSRGAAGVYCKDGKYYPTNVTYYQK